MANKRTFIIEVCSDELEILAAACGQAVASEKDERRGRWLLRARDLLLQAPLTEPGPAKHPSIWSGNTITFITFLSMGDL